MEIEQKLQLGQYNTLEVIKELDFGLYLDGHDGEEILIPRVYVPEGTKIGDFLTVFLYRDSEDRLIATTLKPFAVVGDFAYLQVRDVSKLGVFLDWGLMKDLLVPFGEQNTKMALGRSYLVKIYIDDQTERIVASGKLEKFFDQDLVENLQEGQAVEILPYQYTDMGVKALIKESGKYCMGIVYKNEIFKELPLGEYTQGFIKKIREDGKIDLRLEMQGFDRIDTQKALIMKKLEQANGTLPFGDKTDAEIIYQAFQMSKKDFKKAIGGLFREQKITLGSDSIRLAGAE
jgi:uncharacterized protein